MELLKFQVLDFKMYWKKLNSFHKMNILYSHNIFTFLSLKNYKNGYVLHIQYFVKTLNI